MTFDPENIVPPGAKIKVLGIGGGGGNAVNTMIRSNIEGVEFIAANTDVQALRFSLAPTKIQLGCELTKGLGAGADPDVGRDSALEDRHAIQEALEGADMVFITAGMGGGTGTGGAAVAAQIARELGALTVGVVTKPFGFEGKRRKRHADIGIARLQEQVDTLITIPNQRLLQVASPDLTMIDAFRMADNVLVNAVRGISDIINVPGTVNVDFADVKTVMSCMGRALMGIGVAEGENRAAEAARQAIASPLLEDVDIEGATGILINITAGENITLMEVNEACSIVQDAAHEDANIIFGAVIDENCGNQIRVTVIATGFPSDEEAEASTPDERARLIESAYQPSRIVAPSPRPRTTSSYGSYRTPEKSSLAGKPVFPQTREKSRDEGLSNKPAPSIPQEPQYRQEPVVAKTVEPAFTEQYSAQDDAQELARLTMAGLLASDNQKIEALDAVTIEPVAPATLDAEPAPFRLEGASLSRDEEPSIFDDGADSLLGVDFSADETDEAIQGTPLFGASADPDETIEAVETAGQDAQEQETVATDAADKQIEEALEMADRLQSHEENTKDIEDSLDVPAFLRNGMKDLSLS